MKTEKTTQELLDEFTCVLSNIKAQLNRNKVSSDLDDLREALGIRRKDKEAEK